MAVDKLALFETTKALWPETVVVFDKPDATNCVYQANEKAFAEEDHWRQLALWAFHQSLEFYEKRALANGLPLYPHEVTFGEFDHWMRVSLNGDDSWLEERAAYENS